MTFWAKLLTVLVFVLSIVFAAMSGVIFAKRANYRGELEQNILAFKAYEKSATDRILKIENDLKTCNGKLTEATTDSRQKELMIGKLTGDLQMRAGEVSDLKSEVEANKAQVAQLVEANKALTTQSSQLVGENDKIRTESRTLAMELGTERARANELEKLNGQLKTERDGLKTDLAAARETLQMNEETFKELANRNIEARTVINALQAIPTIQAKVAAVEDAGDLLILNVGKNQGVRKNFEFTIYRDSQFVARANVFDLKDDYSAARVTLKKMPVQRGDSAATRLQ